MGALIDYGVLGNERHPVVIPLFAVHVRAESDHSIDTPDSPPCSGLFESSADHVFAGPFDLAAADRPAFREAFGVVQVIDVRRQVRLQIVQRFPLRLRSKRLACLIDKF